MGPLQLEAAWVLSCIASGTARHAQVVIDAGASDFIHLLSSPDIDIKLLAVWALGNISGESPTNRNSLLHQGALQPLLALLRERAEQPEPGSVLGYATWALSNFCRDQPDWELVHFRSSLSVTFTYIHDQISPALTDLGRLIRLQDKAILIDACWAISFLLDGDTSNKKIQAIVKTGIHKRLTEVLNHSSVCVQTPALDIVTGDDLHTQAVIASGALPAFLSLLSSPDANIRAEACWTISNITAGSSTQIQAMPKSFPLSSTSCRRLTTKASWRHAGRFPTQFQVLCTSHHKFGTLFSKAASSHSAIY
jgi:importin subunit alpha-1